MSDWTIVNLHEIEDSAAGRAEGVEARMGRKQLKKLKVYKGAAHPHEAQKPRALAPIRRTAAPRTTEAN